jgi:hypothetical protein
MATHAARPSKVDSGVCVKKVSFNLYAASQDVFDEQRLYAEYLKQLTAARQSVEWGNGTWQKLFERLTDQATSSSNEWNATCNVSGNHADL